MSKQLKHEEKIEWKGKNFEATIIKVDELTPLELIDVEKFLKNTIQNKKDIIIQKNKEIDNLKAEIKRYDKKGKIIGGLEFDIHELENRLKTVFANSIIIARRNMSKSDKKKLVEIEAKEAEYKLKTKELVNKYKEVQEFQTNEMAA